MKSNFFILLGWIFFLNLPAQNASYKSPPQILIDLVDAPVTPTVFVSPDRTRILLASEPGLPSLQEVAEPELRLGGLRFNPETNGNSRNRYYHSISLKELEGVEEKPIKGLPENPKIMHITWSPDSRKISFTHTTAHTIELWVLELDTYQARRLIEGVNSITPGAPYRWFGDSRHLLIKVTDQNRGSEPVSSQGSGGPVIQENLPGQNAPVRTYQDLLKNSFDEQVFEYFMKSKIVKLTLSTGKIHPLMPTSLYTQFDISPNDQYVLVHQIKKPFSYLVPYYRFPTEINIFNERGENVYTVADLPVAENIPKGFDAVATGPREVQWRSDSDASLFWVEAQDGGDPQKEVEIRDRLFTLSAPFTGMPKAVLDFKYRFGQITWGSGQLAIASEYWWSTRREVISAWSPDGNTDKQIWFDRSYEDRYGDPGNFVTKRNETGHSILQFHDSGSLFLTGLGASPEGNRPFLDQFDPLILKTTRLWQSEAPYFESVIALVDPVNQLMMTRRESTQSPPNYHLRNWKTGSLTALTHFPDPYVALQGIQKELLKYTRKDGVDLTGTLYLPAGYDPGKDGTLPVLMWAYPLEYKSKEAAGQVRNSPYEFLRLPPGSPIYWVLRGYAVFDNFAMPVIGEGDEQPNETFVEQMISGAEAAINKIVEMGVADPKRIGVAGHSYGAFMTANLLAHSDLFAAGIARSGAYNRTLTPFGFQSEERTYWEAPEVYNTMSPFMHADRIKEPILLIHGEADNNSGTFPMQSERFYAALKGHGATSRLVMLPYESHGYRARESVLHVIWEMDEWLEKYVKKTPDKTVKMTTP